LGVYDNDEDLARDEGFNNGEVCGYENGFQDGATFGYNKAKEEAVMKLKGVNMFEKEAKVRAKDYTNDKKRQIAYECGFLDGADKANEYAKTIIQDLLSNSDEYARQRATDFLKEE